MYQAHGSVAAGVVVIAAGVYELTPLDVGILIVLPPASVPGITPPM